MSNWSDGKCNFFLYWLRYIQVTHQRESDYWVIWVTKSVTQSVWKSMYAQKLRPPLSGVRFTEMGKRMGRGDQQFSTWKRWICVKDLFVWAKPSCCFQEASVNELLETSKHALWGSWALNDSFRACESNISMASRRRKKCDARDGKRRDPNLFQRTTCLGKIWLPWRFYLPAYYYNKLNPALSLVTFHCETNYFCCVPPFEGTDARRELITSPNARSAACDPSLMVFN